MAKGASKEDIQNPKTPKPQNPMMPIELHLARIQFKNNLVSAFFHSISSRERECDICLFP